MDELIGLSAGTTVNPGAGTFPTNRTDPNRRKNVRVDVEGALVDAGRQSRVQALRETLRNRQLVRDLRILGRRLEGL